MLIPKKISPGLVIDYRSITLLNRTFKIFLKVLTSRLTPHLQDLIGDNYIGFITERNIFDGVAIP